MRPLNLIINAFGPYASKVEIPFSDLGENGIYLITGDTGAGKTTIFDAISFALYGEASGEYRKDKAALRSDFADKNNKTYVILEFMCHGEIYKIKRSPKTNDHNSEVELTLPNGKVYTKEKEANIEIENLIGLNKKQFSQIVMIAQGEFQKLLNAKTEDRGEIFRNIFSTQNLQIFQSKLYDNFIKRKELFEDLKNSLIQYSEQILSADNEKLATEISNLKNSKNIYNTEELLEELKNQIKKDETDKKTLDKEKKSIKKELEKLNQTFGNAQNIENTRNDIQKLETEIIPQLELDYKIINDKFVQYENKKAQNEKLAIEVAKLEKDLSKYETLQKLSQELDNTVKENDINNQNIEKLNNDLTKSKIIQEKLKKLLQDFKTVETDFEKEQNSKQKNIEKIEKLSEINKQNNELISENQNLKLLQNNLKQLSKDWQEKNQKYSQIYTQFIEEQAGILAKDLIPNKPCPVCGSTAHPNPAKLINETITKDYLEQLQKISDSAQNNLNQEANKITKLQGEISTLEKTFESNFTKLFNQKFSTDISKIINEELEKTQKIQNEIEDRIKNLSKKINEKNNSEKELEKVEKSILQQEKDLKSFDEIKNKFSQIIGEKSATLKTIQKELEYTDSTKAIQIFNEKKLQYESFEKEFKQIQTEKEKANADLISKKETLKTLQNQIKNAPKFCIEELKEQIKALKENENNIQEQTDILNSRFSTNNNLKSRITTTIEDIQKTEKELQIFKQLSDTANGKLNGTIKMTFEQYIQSAYFDMIIDEANKRFLKMTNYQYRLERKEEKKGNAKVGLDLNVFDYHTGKFRSVSTLSGGESFKAALSLALGLSDVVQNYSGGIKIEAMFVDEGFGSLDEESLEQAMNTLYDLTEGNRIVGIISHVAELRNRIDKKILIKRSLNGSSIEIKQ